MNKPTVLNCRDWSPIKKGAVVGMAAGALITGLPWLLLLISSNFFTAMLALITLYPTGRIYQFFDWRWGLGTASPNTGQIICSAFLINSILLALAGGILGWLIQCVVRNKDKRGHR